MASPYTLVAFKAALKASGLVCKWTALGPSDDKAIVEGIKLYKVTGSGKVFTRVSRALAAVVTAQGDLNDAIKAGVEMPDELGATAEALKVLVKSGNELGAYLNRVSDVSTMCSLLVNAITNPYAGATEPQKAAAKAYLVSIGIVTF